MFDRHFHGARALTTQINVTEKRAPTDESVRLLAEMEKAARDQIINGIRLENCPIDCVIHAMEDHMTGDRKFAVFLKLNGKRLEVRKDFQSFAHQDQIIQGLLEATARKIAAELLAQAFNQLPRHLRIQSIIST